MDELVAMITERDQVFFGIVAGVTSRALVMNLKLLHGPAVLASPIVPLEHLSAQLLIVIRV